MPSALGMPPMPAGLFMTRRLSVIANWPSRKKPSRGVIATQFGLPRPALSSAIEDVCAVSLARRMSSSLISKGLSFSKLRRVTGSMENP